MVKILLINIRIYSNTNINKQTNFEYDFWPKVKAPTPTNASPRTAQWAPALLARNRMKYYSYIKRIDKTKTKSSQHDDDCL